MMVERTSRKKEALVQSGRTLFMRYGIKRVTVEEICRTASVSKMTFYKHFKNKIALAIHILEELMQEGENRYNAIMARKIPYWKKAEEIIRMKIDFSREYSSEMLQDFMNSSYPEIRDLLKRKTEENFKLFLEGFNQAQKNGDIRPDVKPEFILYFLNHMMDLLKDENLLKLYDSPLELTHSLTHFFFFGILSKRPPENMQ